MEFRIGLHLGDVMVEGDRIYGEGGSTSPAAAIVKRAFGREPIVVVHVNTQTGAITGVETPPPHVLWGDISTPLF